MVQNGIPRSWISPIQKNNNPNPNSTHPPDIVPYVVSMTDIAKETFLIVIEYRMLLGSIKKTNYSIGDDTNKKQPWGLSLFNPYVASICNIQKKNNTLW